MSLIEAYEAGFNAYVGGKPKSSNPYHLLSELWERWNRGWSTAKFGSCIK